MLFYVVAILALATLPFALLKVVRNQATGLDFAALILNSQCLVQVYQFGHAPSTAASYYGLGDVLSLLFLVAAACLVSMVWLSRQLSPGNTQNPKR